MVPGADHVHGSFTNSASSILRRRIHGFAIPATNDERFLKKYLGLDIVLNGNRRQSSNPKFNAALSQCFTKRQCASWYNVEDSARMFPRQPMDYCHNDPF